MLVNNNSTVVLNHDSQTGSLNYRGGKPIWDLKFSFKEVNSKGPVCILIPGYRSRGIDSADNGRLTTDITKKHKLSTLAYSYSGCDHFSRVKDPATIDTYIEDTQKILESLGNRPNILISKSMGLNVALAAANENTCSIVAALPVVDFYETLCEPYLSRKPFYYRLGFHTLLSIQGFCCWKPSGTRPDIPFIKITKPFIESLKNHKLDQVFQYNSCRMPVHLIANNNDRVASPESTQIISDRLAHAGYSATFQAVSGQKHIMSPDTNRALLQAIDGVVSGYTYG